ncbi:hypothetical protein H4J02_12695 [Protaetiibacter sp. SSC-01]|uniref:hypothetical protein n=1 Tax=Protaetiibacter sp. SSC-01 TaxID=2759943 RepID=UPI001656B7DA|nr:hypothetical protein [Protaetiibacter sp. SSC-01]QNO37279.1 hypothetical protein H4J02_12695 [Protaetiibacter sp. SSC-01]
MAGFDLGGLGDAVGGLLGGKGLDAKALQGLWEQVQPTLKGLDTDQILDTIGDFAKNLNLPLVKNVPDKTIEDIKNGVKVPVKDFIKGL